MKDDYRVDLTVGDNSAEDIQRTINNIVKWGGIVLSFILGILLGYLGGYDSYGEHKFNFWTFIVIFAGGSALTMIIWSTSMILINISDNLRSIKHLLAQQGKGMVISSPEPSNTPKPSPAPSVAPTPSSDAAPESEEQENAPEEECPFAKGQTVVRKSDGVKMHILCVEADNRRVYCSYGMNGMERGYVNFDEVTIE